MIPEVFEYADHLDEEQFFVEDEGAAAPRSHFELLHSFSGAFFLKMIHQGVELYLMIRCIRCIRAELAGTRNQPKLALAFVEAEFSSHYWHPGSERASPADVHARPRQLHGLDGLLRGQAPHPLVLVEPIAADGARLVLLVAVAAREVSGAALVDLKIGSFSSR